MKKTQEFLGAVAALRVPMTTVELALALGLELTEVEAEIRRATRAGYLSEKPARFAITSKGLDFFQHGHEVKKERKKPLGRKTREQHIKEESIMATVVTALAARHPLHGVWV